ncbi:MAG TPA: DNA translocase FtsK, partial [Aggregatilineales bacterium]|nr:DNA translocase FtsK [Aggregatilineales bacterium]
FKLFGTDLALVCCIAIVVGAFCYAIGIRRPHIKAALLGTSHRLEMLAERMKRPPQTSPHVRQAALATEPAGYESPAGGRSPLNVADLLSQPAAARHTPSPAEETAPAQQGDMQPRPALSLPDMIAASKPPANPAKATAPRASQKSQPAPQPVPRRRRYFTVEDFKEVRQTIKRENEGNLPPVVLLGNTELNKPTENEINTNVRIIENTLLEFDIDVEVVDVKVGPTVTQYAVQPFREVTTAQGEVVMQRVRVNKIASLSSDLALALSAKRLRIQPYVPGHPYMGIEVPNRTPSTVALRPVMESETFARAFSKRDPDVPGKTFEVPLVVPLGRDVSGAAFVVDLATMPHLLIAGTTGSGKSVCITALTTALVMNNSPERLNLVLLDPKMVELSRFNGLPHLLGPVETDLERIIGVLRWATREMDRRYKLLEAAACRNIETYNRMADKGQHSERLPYIAILIDEIGDLMLSRPDEMERTLTRLAQMARAVGMHLVVATQRPSVDIITGLIKANFPARISFAVASGVDSRVILDTTGAETLMGRGDMLYLAPDASGPQRLQGCFISDPEIEAVVKFWKDWTASRRSADPAAQPTVAPWERGMTRRESLAESDPLLEDAIALVVREGEASASLIQRRLGIGYPRAAQLLDMLAELGVVGALKDGGRAREVLMKPGQDAFKKLVDRRLR